jgi:hypothetical protein
MMTETMLVPSVQYWLIRVGDGENLRNSNYPFWGVKHRFKGNVRKMNRGDILLFITSKQGDESGKVIAMGEYTEYYDRHDEPLLQINTKTNVEAKIAALGIRVAKGVSIHGFAVNVCNDLTLFNGIVPCGIADYGVCSIKSLGVDVSLADFRQILLNNTLKLI